MSESHASLAEALLAVQAEAKAVQADAINEGFKRGGKPSKYVPLETLMPAILPLLNDHGLIWTTLPTTHDGTPALRYRLEFVGGQVSPVVPPERFPSYIEGTMPLLNVANMQQLGAAITYARRQSLMAVLGLVAEKDDDGVRASRQPASDKKLTEAQRDKIRDALRVEFREPDGGRADLFLTAAAVSTKAEDWTSGDAFKIRQALDARKAAE